MSEQPKPLIRRVKATFNRSTGEVVAILVLIALVSLAALAMFQGQVSEVLLTVSHSV